MKVGDRVKSKFLGEGRFIAESDNCLLYLVHWDKQPPKEYNMGQNPCYASSNEIEEKEE